MSRREPKGAERRLLDAKQARSASKLGKKRQVQLVLPGTFCPTPVFSLLRAVSRKKDSCKQGQPQNSQRRLQLVLPRTLLRAVSIKQTANCRDWETQRDKRETRPLSRRPSIWHPTADPEPASGRKRETSGGHNLEPASQHLASDRGDWETQGDKCKTRRPRSQRHSVWDLTGETLQDTGRQAGDTTRPRSQRHSIWHLTAQTGR